MSAVPKFTFAEPEVATLDADVDRRLWIETLGRYADEARRETDEAERALVAAVERAQAARAQLLRVLDLLEQLVRLHAIARDRRR